MRKRTVTAEQDTPVRELADTMDEENVGSVVITEGDSPVGIVTDRDIVTRSLAHKQDPDSLRASDVMSGELCCIEAGTGLFEATRIASQEGVRRLPVVDGDELAGIVSLDDITRLLVTELGNTTDVIRQESPPYED